MSEKCKAPVEVYSRVCGFFRPVQQWNKGKKQEFADRTEFVVKELNTNNVVSHDSTKLIDKKIPPFRGGARTAVK